MYVIKILKKITFHLNNQHLFAMDACGSTDHVIFSYRPCKKQKKQTTWWENCWFVILLAEINTGRVTCSINMQRCQQKIVIGVFSS